MWGHAGMQHICHICFIFNTIWGDLNGDVFEFVSVSYI
jgi:hypothetical protein